MNGSIVEQGAGEIVFYPGAVVLAKSTASGLILGDDEHLEMPKYGECRH